MATLPKFLDSKDLANALRTIEPLLEKGYKVHRVEHDEKMEVGVRVFLRKNLDKATGERSRFGAFTPDKKVVPDWVEE